MTYVIDLHVYKFVAFYVFVESPQVENEGPDTAAIMDENAPLYSSISHGLCAIASLLAFSNFDCLCCKMLRTFQSFNYQPSTIILIYLL